MSERADAGSASDARRVKVAVLGGSFNPPHVAHVMAAIWVLCARDVDEVWLVPCGEHAFGKHLAPFAHRMALTAMAAAPVRGVHVSDIESRLTPPNYTIDTLEHLRAERPDVAFSVVIGADILHERHKWKSWDVLERDFGFHILGRSGHAFPDGYGSPVELPHISSTDLRAHLAAGELEACRGHMSLTVLDEIARLGLYAVPAEAAAAWLEARS
jgi:nicotinate-nucleotide adenylyltransferase